MAGSMSRHCPEKGAVSGLDHLLPRRCETMMVPLWSCQCTKKTVRPSGVKAGAAFEPVPQSVSPGKTWGTGALDAAARPLHATTTASIRLTLLRSTTILHPVRTWVSANSTCAHRSGEHGRWSAFRSIAAWLPCLDQSAEFQSRMGG